MVKAILRAFLGCGHERTSFPLTPLPRIGEGGRVPSVGGTYVVCLDCGKEFAYDWAQMRVGEPMRHPQPLTTEQQAQTFIS